MNRKYAILLAILMLALPLSGLAQDQDDKGSDWGGYTVRQSIELGGHIVGADGNPQMYSTFVNLGSGPRILGTELSMQSKNHAGVLFDSLYLSSFGFGGDPENLARLRISKNKWYNFVALYRRDKNYFDYNLFANPLNLNAGVTTCAVGCAQAVTASSLPWYTDSPHLQTTTRNMGDFLLTLLPESAISFRLGYARNDTSGTIDTTAGQPFVTILTEDSGWRSDRYQWGVDLKMLPRTTISADIFYEHDKNDLAYRNSPGFVLGASGLPVDIGLNFLPSTLNPACISTAGSPPVFALTTACTAAALRLTKSGNVRTDIPTGQLSFASNYFRKLDITASGSYSSASSDFLSFREFYYGLSPTLLTGPASASHISTNADLGLTYHISKNWSFSDKFRWVNWRQPGALNLTTFTCSHAAAPAPTLLSAFVNPCSQATTLFGLLQAVNSGATVAGNATTGNFEVINNYGTLIGERSYFNTAKLNWRPSRRFSAYLGYKYGRRELNSGTGLTATGGFLNPPPNISVSNTTTISNVCQLNPAAAGCSTSTLPVLSTGAGVDTEKINQHTALFGVMVRPVEAWRINGDLELLYADNFFTNISPRHQQRARVYSNYKLHRWASVNGGLHFVETRNDFAPADTTANTTTPVFTPGGVLGPFYGHTDHWRYYTLGMSVSPNPKFTFDFGWTMLDQDIKSLTCMPLASTSFAPAGSTPAGLTVPSTAFDCATGTQSWALLLNYQETTHSGYTNITYRPVKHVTLTLGYDITGDNGRTNWLRPDTGASLQVMGDVFGNVPPIAGNSVTCTAGTQVKSSAGVNVGCAYPGPFADQPLGPQAINWHKAHFGIAFDVAKGVQFKGLWNYYDYNSKDEVPALALLRVTTPRDFHANVGTISLKYTF
jgi:hypothetical protein